MGPGNFAGRTQGVGRNFPCHDESDFAKYRIMQNRLLESDCDRSLKQIEVGNPLNNNKE